MHIRAPVRKMKIENNHCHAENHNFSYNNTVDRKNKIFENEFRKLVYYSISYFYIISGGN